jgi:hypothetical protein
MRQPVFVARDNEYQFNQERVGLVVAKHVNDEP